MGEDWTSAFVCHKHSRLRWFGSILRNTDEITEMARSPSLLKVIGCGLLTS